MAWRLGLKAVAIYRDGSKRTQPLNTGKAKAAAAEGGNGGGRRAVERPAGAAQAARRAPLAHP